MEQPKLSNQQLVQQDERMLIMLDWVKQCYPDIQNLAILKTFAMHHEMLEELLADRRKFRYLFVWIEEFPDTQNVALEEDLDDEFGHYAEELAIEQAASRIHFEIDGLTSGHSAITMKFVYFGRRREGYMSYSLSEKENAFISTFIRLGRTFQGPFNEVGQLFIQEMLSTRPTTSSKKDYVFSNINHFYFLVNRYAISTPKTFIIPKTKLLFEVPFNADKEVTSQEIEELYQSCISWVRKFIKLIKLINTYLSLFQISSLNDTLTNTCNLHYTEIENLDELKAIPVEYSWWEQRANTLLAKKQDMSLPVIRRTIKVIDKVDDKKKLATEFLFKYATICNSLDEAEDNMKFLNGIKRQVDTCSNTTNIETIKSTIPKVLKCLRSAWTLSKYYNTDENIIKLLQKITNILLIRVKSLVRLNELGQPSLTFEKAQKSIELLNEWEKSFHNTRLHIEKSGREARWEFSVQEIFRPVHHYITICKNVMEISNSLKGMTTCFSKKLSNATMKNERLEEAKKLIKDMTSSFSLLPYDVFNEVFLHHWKNHLSWFERECRFLEVASVGILDDVFEQLVSSIMALRALEEMFEQKEKNKEIWTIIISNLPKIVKQFIDEVEQSTKEFEKCYSNPPIASNLPPISGSIYWANGITNALETTMFSMNLVRKKLEEERQVLVFTGSFSGITDWDLAMKMFKKFQGQLSIYTNNQYKEWCDKVSDILALNLTRPLLTVTQDCNTHLLFRYKVNFTSDLADTLAEVKHLEWLGFQVPEVARNMSIQKTKLMNVATSLELMLNSYHKCIDSLEKAEILLLRHELQHVTTAFSSGHSRLTWNNQAILESCLNVGQTRISIFNYKMRQIHLIKKDILMAIEKVRKGRLVR